jgi:hypothetical protein
MVDDVRDQLEAPAQDRDVEEEVHQACPDP